MSGSQRNLLLYISKCIFDCRKNLSTIILLCISINCNSQFWKPLGAGLTNNGIATFIKKDSSLFIGGSFYSSTSNLDNIVFWNSSSTFGELWPGILGGVNSMCNFNGDLYVGGNFSNIASTLNAKKIARWDGTDWHNLNDGVTNGYINTMTQFNGELYVGGNFQSVDNLTIYDIAKWNGVNWSPVCTLSLGLTEIHSMIIFNGELYVGGYVSSVNGISVSNIFKFDGANWSDVGGGFTGGVHYLYVDSTNNRLFATGNISIINSSGTQCPSNIAYWDGSNWYPFGNNQILYPRTICIYKNELYVGLEHTPINSSGDTLNYICKWDGLDWMPLSKGLNSVVRALIEYHDELIVGGSFTQAGDSSVSLIAVWSDTLTSEIEYEPKNVLIISPNPAMDKVAIDICLENYFKDIDLFIFDYTGKKVLRSQIERNQTKLELDISNLSPGSYQIILDTGTHGGVSKKLMVVK